MSVPIVRAEIDYLLDSKPNIKKVLKDIDASIEAIKKSEKPKFISVGLYNIAVECLRELGRMHNTGDVLDSLGWLSFDESDC